MKWRLGVNYMNDEHVFYLMQQTVTGYLSLSLSLLVEGVPMHNVTSHYSPGALNAEHNTYRIYHAFKKIPCVSRI